MRITMIGDGAVAEGLAREFTGSGGMASGGHGGGVEIVQQWARRTHSPGDLAPADLYILATSDAAVPEVSAALPFPPGSVVAHTAGCVDVLDLSPSILHRAVFYPFQSFTRGRRINDFRRTPVFIEGTTPRALDAVRTAAETISDRVTEMSSRCRVRLHLAGVFAANFLNGMLSLGEELIADAGEDFDVLKPIVIETFTKALDMPSPRGAQTGAAQRGDRTIQAKHLAILADSHPELIPLYEEISRQIWRISKKN